VQVLGEVRGDAGGDVGPVVGGVGVVEEGDAGGDCCCGGLGLVSKMIEGGAVGGGMCDGRTCCCA